MMVILFYLLVGAFILALGGNKTCLIFLALIGIIFLLLLALQGGVGLFIIIFFAIFMPFFVDMD